MTGTTSPVNGFSVPAPAGAVTAAMTDSPAPGSHSLSQSFVVSSAVTSAVLSFDIYIANRATAFFTPSSLDFRTAAFDQQARVDIIKSSASIFSVAAGDVLLNAY